MLQAKRYATSTFLHHKLSFIALLLFVGIGAFAQLGEIVPQVPCLEDEAQTYALYRPSHYTRKKRWPAMIILDPKGQSQAALASFQKGAESYGFILASPNGLATNQDRDTQKEIVRQVFEDIIRRFAIDIEAIYVGGADRAGLNAARFAMRIQTTAGVVLCNPTPDALEPLADYPKPLVIAVGQTDPNAFPTRKWLATHGPNGHRALQFSDSSHWPAQATGEEILGWLALKQWRLRPKTKPEGGLNRNYSIRAAYARDLETRGQLVQAHESWQALVTDFPNDEHLPPAKAAAMQLGQSPALKQQLEALEEASRMEGQVLGVFHTKFQPNFARDNNAMAENLAWWETQMASLRQIAEQPGHQQAKQHAAIRLIEWVWRRSYLDGLSLLEASQFQEASYHHRLASELFPDQAFAHYAHACSLAGLNQANAALGALEKSLASGLNQPDLLKLQPLFDQLRDLPEFQTLLKRIEGDTE